MKLKKSIGKAAKAIKSQKAPSKKLSAIAKKAANNLKPKSTTSSVNLGALGKKIGGTFSKAFKSIGKAINDIFSPQVKGSKTQCPKNVVLMKVGFMKGADAFLEKEGVQFVNLPSGIVDGISPKLNKGQDHWVDRKYVTDLDRLGNVVRVRAKIDKPVAKVLILYRLIPSSKNAKYSNGKTDEKRNELDRNPNFKHDSHNSRRKKPTWKRMHTNSQGVATGSFIVSQAGKNKYHVEAKLPKAIRKEGTGKEPLNSKGRGVLTNRLVYVMTQEMKGVEGKHPKIDEIRSSFNAGENSIELVLTSQKTKAIDYKANIGSDKDDEALIGLASDALESSSAKPKAQHCIVAVFVDQLGKEWMEHDAVEAPANAGRINTIHIYAKGKRVGDTASKKRPLYPTSNWFRNGEFEYDNAELGTREVKRSMISAENPKENRVTELTVDLSSFPSGKGTLKLNLRLVEYFRNGIAYGESSYLVLSTRADWDERTMKEQKGTIVHEIGHKFQMAANGGYPLGSGSEKIARQRRKQHAIAPDVIDTHYDDTKGHKGNHCYYGCSDGEALYATKENGEKAACVMFGAGFDTRPLTFCPNCSKAMRKVDLSNGWNA